MIIFLYGLDDYRRLEKKRGIVAEFKKKHSNLGLGVFDLAAGATADDVEEFLRSQSIFETKKLAVVEGLFPARRGEEESGERRAESGEEEKKDGKGIAEILKTYLETPNVTILISETKKPVKAFGFLLKPPVLAQEFAALAGPTWEAFVKSEAKKLGVILASAATRFLAGVYQGNSWGLATELQKLAALRSSADLGDLEVLGLEAAPNYWALLNGVKGYDIRARLMALETLLAMSDPAPKLFNILASQWKEKTAQFAGYDLAIKSGKIEYEEALVDAVIG
jgi:DNA polymerase III delta subunit